MEDEVSKRDAEFRAEVREDLREIKDELKKLLGFRAWLIGIATTAGAIASLIIKILFKE